MCPPPQEATEPRPRTRPHSAGVAGREGLPSPQRCLHLPQSLLSAGCQLQLLLQVCLGLEKLPHLQAAHGGAVRGGGGPAPKDQEGASPSPLCRPPAILCWALAGPSLPGADRPGLSGAAP